MKVLVVGGAGYIGSHTVRYLQNQGFETCVLDNLSTGHQEAINRLQCEFLHGDIQNNQDLQTAFTFFKPNAVMHFAACALVGESVHNPSKYYNNNVIGSINLLDQMVKHGVKHLVFSSTCATYGIPQTPTISEDHPQQPINPYGRTKLMIEHAIRDYQYSYDLSCICLRYFNAAGCSEDGLLGEDHDPESHLIPLCFQTLIGKMDRLTVFGNDYPTPDGSCIRDYIHVDDLASAHHLALQHIVENQTIMGLNVGTGNGFSVLDVIECVHSVTGKLVPYQIGKRREGDPPQLVAKADRIRDLLNWSPTHTSLQSIVESAWNWFRDGGKY